MTNERGDAESDETPVRPAQAAGPDATQPAVGEPFSGADPLDSSAPTIPMVLPRGGMGPRVGQLSAQERGLALPRGLSSMTRNVRITLIALSVLLLGACCTVSWSAASAIFPPPGAPVAAASNSPTTSPPSSAVASATDQSGATAGDTPEATLGGDATATPSAIATDTPTPLSPTPTAAPCPDPDPNHNPWGYNFCPPGLVITSPPFPLFCAPQYFPCVNGFWSQAGFVVECKDGLFAKDGNVGFVGVCKSHRGYWRTLYRHPVT